MGSDYIRGSKFRLYELGFLNNFDIGYYLAAANFSDIAAMGAQPIALLSVIRYPKTMQDTDFATVIQGIRAGCGQVGARNVGGDIGSAERLILSATAVGIVEPNSALRRTGAEEGDILCTTGYTGIAGAAQRYFYELDQHGPALASSEEDRLLSSWRRPQALVREGRILRASRVVTSCQDSSDGLKAAIESLASANGVGFVIREGDIPIAPIVDTVARLRRLDTLEVTFGDSVDFQLVFTVAPRNVSALQERFKSNGLGFFKIGTATRKREVVMLDARGNPSGLPGIGWRHATPEA